MESTASQRAARRLRKWREISGLTQAKAAERIGPTWDQPMVSRIERTGPALDELDPVAKALGVDPGDLVTLRATKLDESDFGPMTSGAESASVPDVTAPVLLPSETGHAPGEDSRVSSIAASPSHLALYAIIGKLTEEEADAATEPVLDLVRRAQQHNTPPTQATPPKRKKGE